MGVPPPRRGLSLSRIGSCPSTLWKSESRFSRKTVIASFNCSLTSVDKDHRALVSNPAMQRLEKHHDDRRSDASRRRSCAGRSTDER